MLTREPSPGRDRQAEQLARMTGRAAGTALRLALEPSISDADRLQEVLGAADFDAELLRQTWFRLCLENLQSPSRAAAEAARLVSLALDLQAVLSEGEVARA